MDNKITKQRLKQLLSYDLWKIIAIILAGVLLWSLLFTMFGDSLSEGQSLNVYAYNVTVNTDEMDKLLEVGAEDDFKSYEIRETQFYNFGMYSASNTTVSQQFAAWSSVGQLDIFFVSNGEDMEVTETNSAGEKETVKVSLADNYATYFYDLNALVADAFDYCKRFGGYSADGLNKSDVENYFLDRKRSDNFYRHGMINAAMEVDRFEKIIYAANKMKGYLEDDTLDIWYRYKNGEGQEEKILGVDFGKLDKCGGNAVTGKKAVSLCSTGVTDEESGNSTAEGVVMAVFNNKVHQLDLVYESLAFVVRVIENYSAL